MVGKWKWKQGSLLYQIIITLATIWMCTCGQCDMTAIQSFQDCVYYCVNKYGTDDNTQRKFYNRFTGTCQKAVICKDTPFRVYENRCLQPFENFLIGDLRVSLPQIQSQIQVIVVHGNFNALKQQDMCYPGFYSSRKRLQIGVQIYQQYYCDIPIGSDPATYPTSHGEYFFYQLTFQSQVEAVIMDCPQQALFNVQYILILLFQILYFSSTLHYHFRSFFRRIRRKIRKHVQK